MRQQQAAGSRIKQLRRNLERLQAQIHDLAESSRGLMEHLHEGFHTPIVVVDYSELHRYLYPDLDQFQGTDGFFSDPYRRLWTSVVFFEEATYHKLLLPDYAREFTDHYGAAGHAQPVRPRELKRQARERISDIRSSLKSIKSDQGADSNRLRRALLDHLVDLERWLAQARDVGAMLQDHRTALQRFTSLRNADSRTRLSSLMTILRRSFPNVREFSISRADDVYAAALRYFRSERPDSSAKNDADAIAVAAAVRLQALSGNTRVVSIFSDTGLFRTLYRERHALLGESHGELLHVLGLNHLAHAFIRLGRTGIVSKEMIPYERGYFETWIALSNKLSRSLRKLDAVVEEQSTVSESGDELRRVIIEAVACSDSAQLHLEHLRTVGLQEREIETRSQEIINLLERERQLPGFGEWHDKALETLREVVAWVRSTESLDSARAATDKVAPKVDELAEYVARVVSTIANAESPVTGQAAEAYHEFATPAKSQRPEDFRQIAALGRAALFDPDALPELQRLRGEGWVKASPYQWFMTFYELLTQGEIERATSVVDEQGKKEHRARTTSPALFEAKALTAYEVGEWNTCLRLMDSLDLGGRDPVLSAIRSRCLFESARQDWVARKKSDPRRASTGFRPDEPPPKIKQSLTLLDDATKRAGQARRAFLVWLRNKRIYFAAHMPFSERTSEGWIGELTELRKSVDVAAVKTSHERERWASITDTLGFVHLRCAEMFPQNLDTNLKRARELFGEAFIVAGCDECARHLAEAACLSPAVETTPTSHEGESPGD